MIVLLVACAGPSDPPRGSPPPAPTTPAPAPAPSTAPVPLVGEALAGVCDPAPEPVPTGDDLRRATLADPEALCNDGTPAVLYVRAATDPAHAGDWVLYLDGGRYCESWEICAERWCGRDFYDAHKMSTRWAPERRPVEGITGLHPENPFRGWNQVFFHYCSSDRWSGTRADVVLDGDPPFRLHFVGDRIVGAALEALGAGLVSDDGAEALPSITGAERVLVTGSSAGAQGVSVQLDRIAEALPGVEVRGGLDAMFYVDRELLDPALAAHFASDLALAEEMLYGLWGGVADRSCLAAGIGADCHDGNLVLREHTIAPFLLHHDLADDAIYDGSFAAVMSKPAYVEAALATFGRWEAEGTGSFLLTGCGFHTALSANDRFLAHATAGVTLADALDRFVAGETVTVTDDATLSQSVCAPLR